MSFGSRQRYKYAELRSSSPDASSETPLLAMAAQPVVIDLAPSKSESASEADLKHPEVTSGLPPSEQDFPANPFLDPKVAEHYREVYESAQYECRHVFDPDLKWTPEEEKKLVRKLDWRVCLWACIMFFALQVDRGNLSQAVSDNMLDQLGLTTNDYNYGPSSFELRGNCSYS